MSRCRSCREPIVWAVTQLGRRIPLERRVDGNIVLRALPGVQESIAVVLGAGDVVDEEQTRYVAHFESCPAAAKHRNRRRVA